MRDIKDISHFYFIGIGGIGMSALARYLNNLGKKVAGYDRIITPLSKKLEDEGIDIHYTDDYAGVDAKFKIPESAQVVYTPAVSQNFEELSRFRESGIPIVKRAQLLGQISRSMTCLAIAGTHGKTTTSAILAHLLYKSNVGTTAFLGGILEGYDTNFLCNGNDVMVVEADEFDRSFLQLQPDFAGVTAVDPDHLDIYGSAEKFFEAFEDFGKLVPKNALFVQEAVPMNGRKVGIEQGDYYTRNLSIVNGSYYFDLVTPAGDHRDWSLKLPGRHNLSNALLAIVIALEYGVPAGMLKKALASFKGVERRFSYRMDTATRVIIDDYAHHPTEIDAIYQAVREMYPSERCTVIFQPHLYSRTHDFMDDFAKSLRQFDKVGVLNIYAAREEPMEGVNSSVLCSKIREEQKDSQLCTLLEKEDIKEFILEMDNRIVLMLGAGDIGAEIPEVVKSFGI